MNLFQSIQQAQQELANVVPATPLTENLNLSEEFGATILVAGNIQGKTQTIPMAMYYAIENGDSGLANKILILIVLISVILTFSYNKIIKRIK